MQGRCVASISQEGPRLARIPPPCFVRPTSRGGKGAAGASLGRGPWGAGIAGCRWGTPASPPEFKRGEEGADGAGSEREGRGVRVRYPITSFRCPCCVWRLLCICK